MESSGVCSGSRAARAGGPARGRAIGRGRGTACSRVAARGGRAGIVDKGFNDPDVGMHTLPAFTPTRPTGVHFGQHVLRNTFHTAADFFNLFFTVEMIQSIVDHTNSYAYMKLAGGTHTSYAKSDSSWEETTPDEIRKLIAALIYFGLVRVGTSIDQYWSTKTLFHGLWARGIISRIRFRSLMAFLHVVDPATEVLGNKLRKVESFFNYFKERCKMLYQPKQNVAIDERMVKSSSHRSGILQFLQDKPTRWGIKLWGSWLIVLTGIPLILMFI